MLIMIARAYFSQELQDGTRLITRTQPRKRRSLAAITLLFSVVFFAWIVLHYLSQPVWLSTLPKSLLDMFFVGELAAALTLTGLWGVLIWQQRMRFAPNAAPIMSVDGLYALSPRQFEHYVADVFRARGYKVTVRGRAGDLGVDLEVTASPGKRAIVQCKRYRSRVGPEIVRELYGTLLHERAAHAFLVTSAEISPSAHDWARNKPLTLIDGATLIAITSDLARKNGS
ncbi:MAG: restriction endonuclease [Anaerolineae bacterium]|nr:restriction endonuclease [Anaerolineae bacterium]